MKQTLRMDDSLSETEELDFHYLLTLMPVLQDISAFSWLPELFCVIGHEKLIKLCKYAGGETIQIPTLEELSFAIECIQYYYDIYLKKNKTIEDIPVRYRDMVTRIKGVMENA